MIASESLGGEDGGHRETGQRKVARTRQQGVGQARGEEARTGPGQGKGKGEGEDEGRGEGRGQSHHQGQRHQA